MVFLYLHPELYPQHLNYCYLVSNNLYTELKLFCFRNGRYWIRQYATVKSGLLIKGWNDVTADLFKATTKAKLLRQNTDYKISLLYVHQSFQKQSAWDYIYRSHFLKSSSLAHKSIYPNTFKGLMSRVLSGSNTSFHKLHPYTLN